MEKLKLEVANLITDFWRGTIIRKINEIIDFVNTPVSTGPKVYVALLSQSGTDAPIATIIENTLGGSISYSRVTDGIYRATGVDLFPENKTAIFMGGALADQYNNMSAAYASRSSGSVIDIITFVPSGMGGVPTDELLGGATIIKIEVYE